MSEPVTKPANDLADQQSAAGASNAQPTTTGDVEALKTQLEALHKLTDGQAAQIAGLSARLSSLESRAGSLETSVCSLSSTAASHASKLDELDKREAASPLEDAALKELLHKYGLK